MNAVCVFFDRFCLRASYRDGLIFGFSRSLKRTLALVQPGLRTSMFMLLVLDLLSKIYISFGEQ